MTFDEWWESSPTQQLGESESQQTARRLTARWAWEAGYADAREELLTQFNRTGVDIDAALHGRVNEKSPIANRLRMIAAAQPKWQPIETAPKDGTSVLLSDKYGSVFVGSYLDRGCWHVGAGAINTLALYFWMPLPPAPEKTK